MSDGAFTFLSWVRRGLATGTTTPTNATSTKASVEIVFNNDTQILSRNPELELIGPGDIVGLDQSVICRVWPPPGDLDAEFASYALIEFDQADLLWRYSPEASFDFSTTPDPTPLAQVRPWLTLVVLEAGEGTLSPPTPENPLGVLTVSQVDKLPLDDFWAWGHTGMAGRGIDPGSVRRRCKVFDGFVLTVQDILTAPPMPSLNVNPFPSRSPYPALVTPGPPGVDSQDAAEARAALVRLLQALTLPAQLTCGPAIARETCRLSIADALTPATSTGRRILGRRTLHFPWNPVSVQFDVPSAGITNAATSLVDMTPLPANSFALVELTLPANVKLAVNGEYGDLKIKLIVNATAGSAPWHFDNIRFV